MEASTGVSAHRGPFNPLAPLGRSWRRLRRRPRAMQVRTALIVIAIVVGLVAWLVLAPSGTPGGAGSAGAAEVASTTSPAVTPPSQADTSTRGVSKTEINVVFPVVAVNSLAGRLGFAEDKEYNEQIPAIHLYVNQVNNAGGIDGRKINTIITQFDPTNDANMQALCRAVDAGEPACLRCGRRHRDVDGHQPAVRHPAGPYAVDQRLLSDDRLDKPRLALLVVDRTRHGPRAVRGRFNGVRVPVASVRAPRWAWSSPTRRQTARLPLASPDIAPPPRTPSWRWNGSRRPVCGP